MNAYALLLQVALLPAATTTETLSGQRQQQPPPPGANGNAAANGGTYLSVEMKALRVRSGSTISMAERPLSQMAAPQQPNRRQSAANASAAITPPGNSPTSAADSRRMEGVISSNSVGSQQVIKAVVRLVLIFALSWLPLYVYSIVKLFAAVAASPEHLDAAAADEADVSAASVALLAPVAEESRCVGQNVSAKEMLAGLAYDAETFEPMSAVQCAVQWLACINCPLNPLVYCFYSSYSLSNAEYRTVL